MPPATKRRKVAATSTNSLTAPAAQRSIQAFGKISKSQVQDPRKGVFGKNCQTTNGQDLSSNENSKKRKLRPICIVAEKKEEKNASSLGEQVPTRYDNSSRFSEKPIESTAFTSTQTEDSQEKLPSPTKFSNTPTKGARSCLEYLALASSSPSCPSSSPQTTQRETPLSSPVSVEGGSCEHHQSQQLPDELQDLVNLHSSFLTALSLHYAHNGSMTPADLRDLGPGIERAWRKRKVTLQDVRRILAIGWHKRVEESETAGSLYLSDYGHGKICVEIADHSDSRMTTRRPVNEEVLNTAFSRDLEQRWICYKTDNPAEPSPSNFLSSLALLPITPCTSHSQIRPLLSKGQRRLEDLKSGAIKAQQKPLSITSANPTALPQPNIKQASARSTDLFSRLKAKQFHQSTLPLPPSTEALARKSALQRLHDIMPVLESLAFSSKKHANDDATAVGVRSAVSPVSFTIPTLVQHLQMSLRNPIGKEEVTRSLRMLAEVAPEWVTLKELGRMLTVTINGAGLRRDELMRKIESLLERM